MAQKKKMADKVDKRNRARVRVGEDAQGKPIYRWVSGKTRAELRAAVETVKANHRSGEDASKITFGQYAMRWYEGHTSGLSPSLTAAYKSMLNKHILPALGHKYIRQVKFTDMQALLNAIDLSHGMVAAIRLTLRQIMRAALLDKIIDTDFTDRLVIKGKVQPPKRRGLTQVETRLLFEAAKDVGTLLYVSLLYFLGLRRGEAVGLRWEDIDWAKKTIFLQRSVDSKTNRVTQPKTESGKRNIPIPQPLLARLKSARGIGWVLPGAAPDGCLSARQVQWLWHLTMQRMGQLALERGEEIERKENGLPIITPHYLRHNYATMLYDSGVSVLQAQAWLGHADAGTTMGIYTHISQEQEARNTDKLDAFFRDVANWLPEY